MTTQSTIDNLPGYAYQVWGGWVWVNNGNELKWSFAKTEDACTKTVIDVVEREGVEALDDDQ